MSRRSDRLEGDGLSEGFCAFAIAPWFCGDVFFHDGRLIGRHGDVSGIKKSTHLHHIEQRRHIRRQAIDYFIFRIRRELGALSATLGGLDALVFTGGIGENASKIRARICAGMEWIGIDIDAGRNSDSRLVVSSELSRVRIMTIPTHKEIVIAQAAAQISSSPLAC